MTVAAVPDRPLDQSIVTQCHADFSKTLEKYAWAIVRDWSLAADVVQTSFATFSRFGGDVVPEARKSWLFQVVHREALRVRERQKRYSQSSQEPAAMVLENQATYEVSPLSKMAEQEDMDQLAKLIQSLPQEQQQVLRLRFFENKTFAEIAATMQTPIGTALSRMRIALERLRSMSSNNEN